MAAKQATTWFLIGVAGLALYLCYRIAEPFLSPIFMAVVLAIVFYPLHARVEAVIRRANVAAILSTTLVMLVVAIPTVFLGIAVTRELGGLYQALSEKSAAQGGLSPFLMHLMQAPINLVGRYVDISQIDVRSTVLRWLDQISRYLVSFGARAFSNILSLLLACLISFFTLFFLFRDGPRIQQRIAAMLPLSHEQARKFVTGISETIVASVYGGIAVGIGQGLLTGIGFWVLGLPSPVVWGAAATLASLVPLVGTGMVWAPATLVLLIGGHWIKALILAIWGAAVVAQIDAVVRPYVVSGRAKMHNLLIFFALLGGVQAFGIMGIFIGPVVVSVTIAVLDMLREINDSSEESADSEDLPSKVVD
jgi:predicted PurR-regulated permease PerM